MTWRERTIASGGDQFGFPDTCKNFADDNNDWDDGDDPDTNAEGVKLYLNLIKAFDFLYGARNRPDPGEYKTALRERELGKLVFKKGHDEPCIRNGVFRRGGHSGGMNSRIW